MNPQAAMEIGSVATPVLDEELTARNYLVY